MLIIAQKCGTVGNQALCFGFCLVVFCLVVLFLFSVCVLCFAYILHFWGKQKKKTNLCVASDGTSLIIKTKHTHLFTVVTGSPVPCSWYCSTNKTDTQLPNGVLPVAQAQLTHRLLLCPFRWSSRRKKQSKTKPKLFLLPFGWDRKTFPMLKPSRIRSKEKQSKGKGKGKRRGKREKERKSVF